MINKSALQHKILTPEEERALWAQMHEGCENSSQLARDSLIENNLRLVASIAASYQSTNVSIEDLFQAGTIGLIRAVDKFDPDKGKLSTYATSWILSEISLLFDNVGRPTDLPLQTARAIREIDKVEAKLTAELRRTPTDEELMKEAQKRKAVKNAKKDIKEIMSLREQYAIELDAPTSDDVDLPKQQFLLSKEPDIEEVAAHKDLVSLMLECLNEKEKITIILYYGLNEQKPLTLKEVGEKLGVQEQRTQQIHASAIQKMRVFMTTIDEISLEEVL